MQLARWTSSWLVLYLVGACALPNVSLRKPADPPDAGSMPQAAASSSMASVEERGGTGEPAAGEGGSAGQANAGGSDGATGAAGSASAPRGQPNTTTSRSVLGKHCQSGEECEGTFCVDAVCCETSKCGECQACDAQGRCTDVALGNHDDTCTDAMSACDGAGRCGLALGASCTPAGDACASKHCERTGPQQQHPAVCCAEACGECETCSAYGDACRPVLFGDDAKTCTAPRTCSSGACHIIDVNRIPASWNMDHQLGALEEMAQTFTASDNGKLIEARFIVLGKCASALSLQGVTESGFPDGTPIARSTTTDGPNFLFSGVSVKAGQKLALVLTAPQCTIIISDPADGYAGGALYSRGGVWVKDPGSAYFMTVFE